MVRCERTHMCTHTSDYKTYSNSAFTFGRCILSAFCPSFLGSKLPYHVEMLNDFLEHTLSLSLSLSLCLCVYLSLSLIHTQREETVQTTFSISVIFSLKKYFNYYWL